MPKLRLRDLKVRDFMSREVVTAAPDEPVSEILGRMKTHDLHELPVVRRNKLLGVVSMAAIARRKAPPATKAKALVRATPEASPDLDLPAAAERLLSSGHRSIPVVEKGKLVGILSRSDVVRALADVEEIEGVAIAGTMTPQPQCVHVDDTITQARSIMTSLGERAIPVVDQHRNLVGVVGLKDITALFSRPQERPKDLLGDKEAVKVRVGSIMKPPISVPPSATLSDALSLMTQHRISTMIVEEERQPIGILTTADLMEFAARHREREGILVQISGLEEQVDVYDQMYAIIQKAVRRIGNLVTPRVLNIHVHQYKAEGDRAKWSLRARFATEHEMYYLKHFDWDLFRALDGLLDQLEGQLKKEKDRRIGERKRHHL